jgi:hypothetical protein
MRSAGTAIMGQHPKTLEPQCPHHFDLIGCHRPETLLRVVGAHDRLIGIAIAAQIRHDHGEVLSQAWGHPMPERPSLRVPMEQQQRRALTSPQNGDRERLRRIGWVIMQSIRHPNPLILKAWKQTTQGRIDHGLGLLIGRIRGCISR